MDMISCSCCNGSGKIELNGIYADTLAAIRRLRNRTEFTGAEFGRLMVCKATAMNNRLAALERLGFLTSKRYGQQRRYRLKAK